ncbi:pre-rRNA-processing protein TSR1 homolog isoform X1 [Polistes fuscatus]|uniref:pre-rRNA-processing protein TSR1 homolog isoform X1 n=1 Tax=Polistes fuscatus TaxID=30207 RepID=UPI001CA9DEB5|nr:pre-rRNA-processing protein TSR1 homolog isoform X1 [Polistes fuscatus]XP_043497044.1 pre-rRNA-processing protein TSR1 homolog isoform X1 [Polistes fuscatus]
MAPTKNQETHRPGAFKQINKVHKTGRHRSKGVINNEVKGKKSVKVISKQIHKNLNRDARRHQSLQLRKKKMEEMLAEKRKLGKGSDSAPVLICIIPLQENLELQNIVDKLKTADDTINSYISPCGTLHMNIPRMMKQRFSIIVPPINDFFGILDAAKVANTVLFVTSATNKLGTVTEEIIDTFGNEILYACLLQGLPTSIVAATNVDKLSSKIRQDYKQRVIQSISKYLPEEKVFSLDTRIDSLNVLRRAATQKQRTVTYRTKRPYLLADQLKYISNTSSDDQGTLQITGYLQGSPISVNGLIHIPGFKDFQLLQIDLMNDPYVINNNKKSKESEPSSLNLIMDSDFEFPDMEDYLNDCANRRAKPAKSVEQVACYMTLASANPNEQESLQSENIPDLMDAEQTWPTEEELAQAEAARKKKIVKVVPKGTSAYQAAWIPDEDAEDLSECSENESDDKMSVDDANSQADSETNMASDDEEYETITISEAALDEYKYDQDIDMMEEKEAMEKINRAKLDAQFPDEIDTPQNMLAKVRFQKYRGLESFRTSPWDPKENLPQEYARIFQFENFDRTRKRIFKKNSENEIKGSNTALPGWYIKLHVANVPRSTFVQLSISDDRPVIVFGLLPNEQKMSLLNIVLKHANIYQQAIKSKERLVFQCGYRRFSACPIFSQHTNGSKHKYERFFRPEMIVVASMYAPIIFPPCPVLCFIEHKDGSRDLVASGSVLSVNPDRIVVKRVVLSGHPFKVHKNSAIVRFMFFNREDINWFKPVQLRTKYGRRGHIKEPLGTHGHMKCVFNGQLKSQDTILMNLYKRVFPKWTYEPII